MAFNFNPTTGQFDDAGQSKTGQIVVRAKEQLAGTLDSTKVYFIDGVIDMGTQTIEVPTGGLTLEGHGYDISVLFSTENSYSMFTSPVGSFSGNLTINNNNLYVTGTSSKIFDVDNDGNFSALEMNAVNLGDFGVTTTSLGEITAYRQIRTSNFAAINYADGLTISGDVGGLAFNDSIILSPIAATTFIQEGTSLLISDGMSTNMNALNLTGNMEWCDFDAANFDTGALMSLVNFRTNADDALPNLPVSSIKRLGRDCVGIENTFMGGRWKITTETTTTISTVNTPVKLAGTTTYTNEVWFSNTTSNAFVYDGESPMDFTVSGNLVIDGGANDDLTVTIRKYDDSAAAFVDVEEFERRVSNVIGGLDVAIFNIDADVSLDTDDRIEIWIENNSDTTNVEALIGSYVKIRQR